MHFQLLKLESACKRSRRVIRIFLWSAFACMIISLWFQGTVILLEIDAKDNRDWNRFLVQSEQALERVDTSCRLLERESIVRESSQGVPDNEALLLLERAQREKVIRDNLIYIPELKQMWCLAPKAASTSWSRAILNELNGKGLRFVFDLKTNLSLQVILRQTYGNISKKTYEQALRSGNVKKIILTRHPFSRIASAYQDKLEDRKINSDGMFFFQNYGVKINRSFRKNRRENKRKEPTFNEFVSYLVNTDVLNYDEHWMPIHSLCGLCHVRYDHIIFQENLKASVQFHARLLGMNEETALTKENVRGTKAYELFQNISSSKKIKLLQKYKEDFRIFGYSFLQNYVK